MEGISRQKDITEKPAGSLEAVKQDIYAAKYIKSKHSIIQTLNPEYICLEKGECPICYSETSEAIKCGLCKQLYHSECIKAWFKDRSEKKCPYCNTFVFDNLYKTEIIFE